MHFFQHLKGSFLLAASFPPEREASFVEDVSPASPWESAWPHLRGYTVVAVSLEPHVSLLGHWSKVLKHSGPASSSVTENSDTTFPARVNGNPGRPLAVGSGAHSAQGAADTLVNTVS